QGGREATQHAGIQRQRADSRSGKSAGGLYEVAQVRQQNFAANNQSSRRFRRAAGVSDSSLEKARERSPHQVSFRMIPFREIRAVRRHLASLILLIALFVCAALSVVYLRSVSAQTPQNPSQNSATPVKPNDGAIIGG